MVKDFIVAPSPSLSAQLLLLWVLLLSLCVCRVQSTCCLQVDTDNSTTGCSDQCTFCAPGNGTEAIQSEYNDSVSGNCRPFSVYDSTCVTYTYNQLENEYRARYTCGGLEGAELTCDSGGSWRPTGNDMDCGDLPSCTLPSDCGRCQDTTVLDQENSTEFCRTGASEHGFFASPDPRRVVTLVRYVELFKIILNTAVGSEECANNIQELMCGYIFPVCGSDGLPMAPCPSYCSCVLDTLCMSEFKQVMDLARESSNVFQSGSPFAFIDNLSPANCSSDGLSFYNWPYSNSCIGMDLSRDLCGSPDRNILIITIASSVGGTMLIVLLLCCVCCCCCCWRRRKYRSKYFGNVDSYPSSHKTSRAGTLLALGWPFVHPQRSKFKAKGELFKLVPKEYKEVISDNQQYLLQPSRMHTTVFLAEGSHSEVYQGYMIDLQPHETSTYRNVAIKRFKEHIGHSDVVDYLESCFRISNVNHPSVLKLIAVTFDELGSISIAYPYMEEHDLLTYLKKKRAILFSQNGSPTKLSMDFSVQTLVDIVLQIAKGMQAISEVGIPYKMLSAHTCLVDAGPRITVGDICIYLQLALRGMISDDLFNRWMAPEGFKEKRFTEKSDAWSFGITCWEVFSLGSNPYHEVENDRVMDHVLAGNRLSIPSLCPPAIFSLMERCWEEDPKNRPHFNEIVKELTGLQEHPMLKTDIKRIDEEFRRGSLELSSGPGMPTPLVLDRTAAGFKCGKSRSPRSRGSSPRQLGIVIADVEQEETAEEIPLGEFRTSPRISPAPDRRSPIPNPSPVALRTTARQPLLPPNSRLKIGDESYQYVNPKLLPNGSKHINKFKTMAEPGLRKPTPLQQRLSADHTRIFITSSSEDDYDDYSSDEYGYAKTDLSMWSKRHSVDVPPRAVEDAVYYYNLPKGYLTLLRGQQKSRSSNDLRKLEDSSKAKRQASSRKRDSSRPNHNCKPRSDSESGQRKAPVTFPKPRKPPPRRSQKGHVVNQNSLEKVHQTPL